MTAVPDRTAVSTAVRLVTPGWSGGHVASSSHQRIYPSSLGTFWGDQFVMEFRTTTYYESITLPLTNVSYFNCRIFWGDGQANGITVYNDAALTHTYTVPGTYIVRVRGQMGGFGFNNAGDKLKIYDVRNWGQTGTISWQHGFYGCSNLTGTATDAGQFEAASTFYQMFRGCSLFNGEIGNWNTTNIQNTFAMFRLASIFNKPIDSWNMGNVSDMSSMFYSANAFNQNVGGWKMEKVTNTSSMLRSADSFNQDLSAWNMSKVSAMTDMWTGATAMNQANVDNFLKALYTHRMNFTWATPTVSLASCAAPSGTYADEDPPTTGNGYRYELVNDPETEGFNKWSITVAS